MAMAMAIETKNIASEAETVAKVGGKHGSVAEEGKSLFLAFCQTMVDGTICLVVKSIKLTDAIYGGCHRPTSSTNSFFINSISSKLVRGVGYSPLLDYDSSSSTCGLFRSNIIFAGMVNMDGVEQIWEFKADKNLKPNFRINPFKVHTFNYTKIFPLLVELQGSLYALNNCFTTNKGGFMEVFDPTQSKWLSTPDPPIITGKGNEHFSIVVAGQKILLSNPDVRGVFCFQPEMQNWKAIPSLGAGLPFHGLAQAFDDDACGGFLIFKYSFFKPDTISVFFMSHQFDPVQNLKSVELPFVPPEFCNIAECSLHRLGVGGRKFCLVLNRFFTKEKFTYEWEGFFFNDFPEHKDKGILLFITFEYEITKSGSKLEGNYKILNANRIEYTPEHTEDKSAVTLSYRLHGAFVLNSMEDEDNDA